MADISRGLVDVKNKTFKNVDSSNLATRFNTMLKNVASKFENNGPTYAVWIYFQLGITKPIIFDSSSTNKNQNLIASLNIKKGGSGCANTFTLKIVYDAFDFGQNTKDQIEQLDELIAEAMSVDWNKNESSEDKMQGILQYGYSGSGGGDDSLVSPQYRFYLTNAKSSVRFDSGLSEYTFEGVSKLAGDCDFTANFEKVENKGVMTVIANTLYKYYGKNGNAPNGADSGVKPVDSALSYYIDIPKYLVDDQCTVSLDAATGTSPWQYCLDLLSKEPLTKSQKDSEEYKDTSKMNFDEIPRYTMYITDDKDRPTIHVAHITPKESKTNTRINYEFTWSLQKKNIVVEWKPEVDLYQYIIRKFNHSRVTQDETQTIDLEDEDNIKNGVTEVVQDKFRMQQDDLLEMYNATLTLVGIPADPPLTAEVRVQPRILQNVSRTAGVYIIQDCEDDISTAGVYTTTLKLFRTRSLNEKEWTTTPSEGAVDTTPSTQKATQEKEKEAAKKSTEETSKQSKQ